MRLLRPVRPRACGQESEEEEDGSIADSNRSSSTGLSPKYEN